MRFAHIKTANTEELKNKWRSGGQTEGLLGEWGWGGVAVSYTGGGWGRRPRVNWKVALGD